MAKKNEVKKRTGKATKTSKPIKAAKTKSVESKAPVKMQKKSAQVRAKAETTLKLEAPQAKQVSIVGSFNEWDPHADLMRRDKDGAWRCTLVIDPGEYEYRFFVDGAWCDDPENMLRCQNEFGTQNCVLIIQD